ncbi:MAG: 30S ribosomal protein S12 methylthiotransferase RimO, partial [Muribaculaceae bacterium]|nr:30S ribosomal protein S12 methylthiotransferase RimO [Muribaculaceae bacterium]
ILGAIAAKERGEVDSVYAMGCLTGRYRSEIEDEIPELDGIYGKFDWDRLVNDLTASRLATLPWERRLSTAPHYTYLKISEGCNRFCAYCAIPLITGRHVSRPVDEIVTEVESLVADGTVEFNIIAQDLSSYGLDLPGGKSRLAELIDRLAVIPGVEMLRLHYAYPADFPYDMLDAMARHPQVCRYLDIALQHIDDTVLSNMRRHITADETRELLKRIRQAVPGIHIRTTMMVGFPGETDEAFGRLMDFVAEQRFERLGAFAYCEEDGTFAARNLEDSVPEHVKQSRLDKLMALQQEIAFDVAEAKVGQTLRVIIDEETDTNFIGRTEYDSPEVDCCVFVEKNECIKVGGIYNCLITGTEEFDLYGVLA